MDAFPTAEEVAQQRIRTGTARDGAWLSMLRRYLLFTAAANFAWEIGQLPLYTIWTNGTFGEIAFAVLHCTGGDVMIAAFSILGGLLVFGSGRWPFERYAAVAASSVVIAVAFTVYSEWRNVEVLGNWSYSEWMPTLPLVGTGLSPLAQWIVIPIAAFRWAGRMIRSSKPGDFRRQQPKI